MCVSGVGGYKLFGGYDCMYERASIQEKAFSNNLPFRETDASAHSSNPVKFTLLRYNSTSYFQVLLPLIDGANIFKLNSTGFPCKGEREMERKGSGRSGETLKVGERDRGRTALEEVSRSLVLAH